MPDIRPLDDTFAVAPQLDPADLPAVAAAGYRTIINNRPDDEEPGQPSGAAMAAAAAAAGLAYHAIPVAGGFAPAQLAATRDASAHGPVLAFCRSGTRSCHLWALAAAQGGADPVELIARAGAAGYDLTPLSPTLARLARR